MLVLQIYDGSVFDTMTMYALKLESLYIVTNVSLLVYLIGRT